MNSDEVRFTQPFSKELEVLNNLNPETRERILSVWENERNSIILKRVQEMQLSLLQEQNLHKHRTGCLFLGSALALGAMGLGVYGISHQFNLFALAALITPIVGLAGVFLWGFQRKS